LALLSPFAIFAENRMRLGKPGTSSRFLPAFTIFVEENAARTDLRKLSENGSKYFRKEYRTLHRTKVISAKACDRHKRNDTSQMSVIDLIVGLLMLWAVFNGWRQGLILQLCSLAGIVLGGMARHPLRYRSGRIAASGRRVRDGRRFPGGLRGRTDRGGDRGTAVAQGVSFRRLRHPGPSAGCRGIRSQDAADPGAALLGVRISEQGPYAGRGKDARPVGMLPSDDPSGGFALPAARMGQRAGINR